MTLSNKSYKDFSHFSRYTNLPYFYNSDTDYYVNGLYHHLSTSTSYSNHVVDVTDTLDNLSVYYYGDPTKYWLIADFNRIIDPFKPLTVGSTLKIPDMASIEWE